MPRTKQVRKKSTMVKKQKQSRTLSSNDNFRSSNILNSKIMMDCDEPISAFLSTEFESYDHLLKEFQNLYDAKIEEHRKGYERACERVKEMIADSMNSLPDCLKLQIVHGDLAEDFIDEENKDPNSLTAPKGRKSKLRIPDDLSNFKKPKTPGKIRSVSRNRSATNDPPAPPAPPTDGFKTPVMSNRNLLPGTTITPKIYSATPISVMRRPIQGEMAISMSGSPLMVGAVSRDDVPTVNVPLLDGRVFSIMPEAGAPPPDLPGFDETTKKYLQTLRKHLEILAPNSP